ncbi:MAG: hypothetical protein K6E91_14685 [Butyrivibrio sp.]|nr:hypothetical protein [Butyrivibrio sp.]
MSIWAADKTNDEFWIFYHDLRGLSHQVENVIRNPENYEMADLQQPQKQNAGKYVLQILYPDGADNADPASEQMLGRLSNLSPLMEEIVRGNEGYTLDCCIAMPDGTTIVLDNLSDKKVDEEGNADTYDASVQRITFLLW